MLTIAAIVLALCFAGSTVVAKAAQTVIRRFGLDPWTVLEWLGLAETPLDELAARRYG